MRILAHLGRVAVTAGAVVTLAAGPAAAHNLGSAEPTNYRTRITNVTGAVPGVDVRVVEAGGRLELTNRTGADVIVLGYEPAFEDYLRIGPRSVFENRRSPATYQNRFRLPSNAVPAAADATAEPEWVRVSAGRSVRWHDHRTHWMGTRDHPKVRRDPGTEHHLHDWEVPLRYQGKEIVYQGDLTWVPGPSRWGRLGLASAAGAALVGFAALRRSARTDGPLRFLVASLLALLLVLDVVRLAGMAEDADVSLVSAAGDNTVALLTWAATLAAVVRLLWRGLVSAAPLVAAAGLLFVAGSVVDLDVLARSQLPSTVPNWLSRTAVAAGFGLGIGLAGVAVARIVRPPVAG